MLSNHPVTYMYFPHLQLMSKFNSDSPESDGDGSSPHLDTSTSLDGASVTPDAGSRSTNSSTVTQPEPNMTSTPAQSPCKPELSALSPTTTHAARLGLKPSFCSRFKFVIDKSVSQGTNELMRRVNPYTTSRCML